MSRIVENDKNPIDRVVGQTATTPLVLTVADANRIAIESTGNGPAPKLSRFAVERLRSTIPTHLSSNFTLVFQPIESSLSLRGSQI